MFKNITEIKNANTNLGHNFFAPKTMKFFGSKTYPKVYAGRYFITSEDNYNQTRKMFSIREARPNGDIGTVGQFGEYTTFENAFEALQEMLSKSIA